MQESGPKANKGKRIEGVRRPRAAGTEAQGTEIKKGAQITGKKGMQHSRYIGTVVARSASAVFGVELRYL